MINRIKESLRYRYGAYKKNIASILRKTLSRVYLPFKLKVLIISVLKKYFFIDIFKQDIKKVSVVIPNYNYATYLKQRLLSILEQDYPIFEIIFLDDASDDNSPEVFQDIASKYKHQNIKTINNRNNSNSPFLQWKKGVDASSGDFVWIAESDDYSSPRFLTEVMRSFHDDKIALSYCQSVIVNADGYSLGIDYLDYVADISTEKWKKPYNEVGVNEIRNCMAIKNTIPNVSAVVFKKNILKECFEKHIEEIKEYKMVGDWLTYVYVLTLGNVSFIPEGLNYHRRHAESIIYKNLDMSVLKEIVSIQERVCELLSVGEDVSMKANNYSQYLYEELGLATKEVSLLSERIRNERLDN